MNKDYYFKCIKCGYESPRYVARCPKCGGQMQVVYFRNAWKVDSKNPTIWRYKEMLPFRNIITLGEGLTPLRKINEVKTKLETRNPTGSYADRASSVILSNIEHSDIKTSYVEDFTISLAYYARSFGKRILVNIDPENISPEDLLTLSKIGAGIGFNNENSNGFPISYEDPFTIEGLKTISYELYEKMPKEDKIYIPAESGLLVYSISKGFYEIKNAVEDFREYEIVAVKLRKVQGPKIIRFAKYKIKVCSVSFQEVLESMIDLAKKGINAKPLAATGYAMARRNGDGIAIITGARKRYAIKAKKGKIEEEIIKLLSDGRKRTAYEIWQDLNAYSLKGIYKYLEAMSDYGSVCKDYELKGGRKVKIYFLC